jgi:hypothetical protein
MLGCWVSYWSSLPEGRVFTKNLLAECTVGLVIAWARHTAKIRAKTWHFTAYLVLKDASSLKTVCPRTKRLSVPVIYFHITPWFGGELTYYMSRIRFPTDAQLFSSLNKYGLITVEVRPIQSIWDFFWVYKKTRAFEKGCIVAKKGAIHPIF